MRSSSEAQGGGGSERKDGGAAGGPAAQVGGWAGSGSAYAPADTQGESRRVRAHREWRRSTDKKINWLSSRCYVGKTRQSDIQ